MFQNKIELDKKSSLKTVKRDQIMTSNLKFKKRICYSNIEKGSKPFQESNEND